MEVVWPRILELSDDLQTAAKLLHEAYQELVEGNCSAAKQKSNAINELESAADSRLKELEKRLLSSDLFPMIRQYVLETAKLLDDAIDKSMEASRILSYRCPTKQELDELRIGLDPSLDAMFSLLLDIVAETRKMLRLVATDLGAARKQADVVEAREEEIDRVKLKLIEELYRKEDRVKILSMIQFEKAILAADDMADACEDVSDALLNIINLGRP